MQPVYVFSHCIGLPGSKSLIVDRSIPFRRFMSPGSSSEDVRPIESPRYEEVPRWNILPSYQLYASTFLKNLNLSEEDRQLAPPDYNPITSEPQSDYFSNVIAPPLGPASTTDAARWEDSILANTHYLKRLGLKSSGSKNALSPLQITIHLDLNSPAGREYKQGDFISGHVLVCNPTSQNIPFSMFSVVFEGKVSVLNQSDTSGEQKPPLIFYKFINMFDYNASWTPATFRGEGDEIDPLDGTSLYFPMEKYIQANTTYKRFFNFIIPVKLLDCACELHNFPLHSEVLPNFGLARDEFLSQLRQTRDPNAAAVAAVASTTTKNKPASRPGLFPIKSNSKIIPLDKVKKIASKPTPLVRDFCFPDTSLSYSIEARLIGRAFDFPGHFDVDVDQFVLVNEASHYLRVVPKERLRAEISQAQIVKESRLVYENFVNHVEELIKNANEVKGGIQPRRPSIQKRPELFHSQLKERIDLSYNMKLEVVKRSISAVKPMGNLHLETPKTEYFIDYVSDSQLEKGHVNTSMQIPFKFKFIGSVKPPDVKLAYSELVVFTYRSKKYFFPIEIYHDMLFQNTGSKLDNFETIVQQRARSQLVKLNNLTQELGFEKVQIPKQTWMDIKSVARLDTKYNHIKLEHSRPSAVHWTQGKDCWEAEMMLSVDVSKYKTDERTKYRLVPSFQSCVVGRMYYLNVALLVSGSEILVKIPVVIERNQ